MTKCVVRLGMSGSTLCSTGVCAGTLKERVWQHQQSDMALIGHGGAFENGTGGVYLRHLPHVAAPEEARAANPA